MTLIDKAALLNTIATEVHYDSERPLEMYAKLLSIVNDAPDAVVHCVDCKHYGKSIGGVECLGYCKKTGIHDEERGRLLLMGREGDEMMPRLIDADKLKADFIGKRYGTQAIEYVIDQQPTVEAIPIDWILNHEKMPKSGKGHDAIMDMIESWAERKEDGQTD